MRLAILLLFIACVSFVPACGEKPVERIRLASTTSTANTGLLEHLGAAFTADTGIPLRVQAVGTGKALAIGRSGEADVVLVHARALEDAYMAAGHAILRRDVMYNDFVLVGPVGDPAGIREIDDPAEALRKIAAVGARFASRGDESGTHVRELAIWKSAGVDPHSNEAYREVTAGMARCLIYAHEKHAYTLADRGTWLAVKRKQKPDLEVLVEGHTSLHNPYGALLINPERHPDANVTGGRRFIEWLTSERGQELIAGFRVDGHVLFHPNAGD